MYASKVKTRVNIAFQSDAGIGELFMKYIAARPQFDESFLKTKVKFIRYSFPFS